MAKRTKQRPLTAKQERFCQEYIVDLNATQAAIRAKYAANTLNCFQNIGSTNLSKPMIKAEIQRLKAITSEKTGITVEWVVNNLKEVAERCMQGTPVLDAEDEETGEWAFDAGGANRALQLIGMHVDAFNADNKSKADNTRIFTIKELKVLILGADDKDKMIAQTGLSIAGEGM